MLMSPNKVRVEMSEIRQYVEILLESLEKKLGLLQKIMAENKKQEDVLKNNRDIEIFDSTVTAKEQLIHDLESLDSGFEKVYDRIKEELQESKETYRTQIIRMQELISEITDLSVQIQTSEQRNKNLVDNYFSYARGKIRQAKKSVRAANDYYKSMSRTNYTDSYLMDRKK